MGCRDLPGEGAYQELLNETKQEVAKTEQIDNLIIDSLIKDVDFALGRYGMSASLTSGPTDEQKAEYFEEARLALRRVRHNLVFLRKEK